MLSFIAAITCTAIDGDTIRCGSERIRLLGIDAPEFRGHCRSGRTCAKGNPKASKASLAKGLRLGPIKIERHGKDKYGRTLAFVSSGGNDLSCYQLKAKQAVYVKRWDYKNHLKSQCRID